MIDSATSTLWNPENLMQEFTSAKTSINANKLPRTFSILQKMNVIKEGYVIADIGGGKFDNAIDWASKNYNANLFVFDPYNRSTEYNQNSMNHIANGQSDIVTVNNVLNVIKESDHRLLVLVQAYDALKTGGKAYILIYEGDSTGIGSATQGNKSWQNNLKTKAYLDEVKYVFGNAIIKNGLIIAEKI